MKLYPVLIRKRTNEKFIVVGEFYNHVSKRSCLCMFPYKAKHYIQVHGFMDEVNGKLYYPDKSLSDHNTPLPLNSIQQEIFNCHLLLGLFDHTYYFDSSTSQIQLSL